MRTNVVHVAGAGCVGPVMAILLARRGYRVHLHEKRPEGDEGLGDRSINLAISARGLHALDRAGLAEDVLSASMPMRGRMVHPVSGVPYFIPYSRDGHAIYSVHRKVIADICLRGALRAGQGRVSLYQGSRLTEFNPSSGEALFVQNDGSTQAVSNVPVIAADGAFSGLRSSLAKQGAVNVSIERLNIEYRELALPKSFPQKVHLAPDALHIWPRNGLMLIALPNVDGSFTCTLFSPAEASSTWSPESLTTPERAAAFFRESFPDIAEAVPNAGMSLSSSTVGRIPLVSCFPWSAGNALLIGDAAHAITPFFGQGLNAGLEDCALIDTLLGEAAEDFDWASVFQSFGASRAPDTDAVAALSLENFDEMSSGVTDPLFLVRRAVESEIQKRFPGLYLTRYELVTFSRMPYREVLEIGRLQRQILDEVCADVRDPSEVDYARAAALISERISSRLPSLESGVPSVERQRFSA